MTASSWIALALLGIVALAVWLWNQICAASDEAMEQFSMWSEEDAQ